VAAAAATAQFERSVFLVTAEGRDAVVAVALSAAVSADVDIYLTARDNTATKGDDYAAGTDTAPGGTAGAYKITIPAGSTRGTAAIATTDDSDFEPNETFTLAIDEIASTVVIGRGARSQMAVNIRDNDDSIVLLPELLALTEAAGGGRSRTYTVRLAGQPTADVTVALTFSAAGVAAVDIDSLTFTDSTWNAPQTVTVTAVDDDIDNPGGHRTIRILHTPTSTDSRFQPINLPVVVADDDTAGFAFTPTALEVAEGGSGTYTVALAIHGHHLGDAADGDGERGRGRRRGRRQRRAGAQRPRRRLRLGGRQRGGDGR